MKPETRFLNRPKSFWAFVRTVSEQLGYTANGTQMVGVPTVEEMVGALSALGLRSSGLADSGCHPTSFGQDLFDYFDYRAKVLNSFVEKHLMDAEQAKALFNRLRRELRPKCPIPMNKQKGAKKAPAFFTGIINMLIEANSRGLPCDFDPRSLTGVTKDGEPLRTMARRVDGAFPTVIDPIAVWEIKEYYYTTTFGSRVADGVYESLLDGMELEELRTNEGRSVLHYLFVDAHYTWWRKGRSYLCRIVDMLHMGYVDEVLFGSEVVEELPRIVKSWTALAK